MIFLNKRGVSVWISYVLLTALVVALGFLVMTFSRDSTQETVDDIVQRGDALRLCGVSGVDVRDLCQSTLGLSMNVTNTNDVKVVGVWARMFDIYGDPQVSSRNVTILPQKTLELSMLKQGVVAKVEIIPMIEKGDKLIRCQSRAVVFEPVPICG